MIPAMTACSRPHSHPSHVQCLHGTGSSPHPSLQLRSPQASHSLHSSPSAPRVPPTNSAARCHVHRRRTCANWNSGLVHPSGHLQILSRALGGRVVHWSAANQYLGSTPVRVRTFPMELGCRGVLGGTHGARVATPPSSSSQESQMVAPYCGIGASPRWQWWWSCHVRRGSNLWY